jgi:hypothetical protein
MGSHDASRQIEAESHPSALFSGHVAAAAELLENAGQVIRVDAIAAVDDFNPDMASASGRAQRDWCAGWRILGGVGQQVAHDLTDPHAISLNRDVGSILDSQRVIAR